MATVHLICGFLGAGKTTFAKALAEKSPAVRLSVDELYLRLFADGPTYDLDVPALDRLLSVLNDIWPPMVMAGVDVILDFGFWRRSTRDETRAKAHALGATVRLHWLRCSDDVAVARCLARNGQSGAFLISEQGFGELKARFEPPAAGELAEILDTTLDPPCDVRVRRLQPSDTELFRAVRLAALAEAPDSFGETLEQAQGSNWQERTIWGASLADRAVFVAVAGDRAVGMVFVSRSRGSESAFLGGMWVDPLLRRRGVGRALVLEGLGFLRAAGERGVSLWVTSTRHDVLEFYERLGFRQTGATDALRSGSDLRITEMTLALVQGDDRP